MAAAGVARRDLRGFDDYTRQLAIRTAAEQLTEPAGGGPLFFLNFIPSVIYRPAFCMRETMEVLKDTGVRPESIVLEAVESNRNRDVAHLRRIADYLREQGFGFGLDDVGVDADAMRIVCELRPDYVKLEKRLMHRMENQREAAAVRRLVDVSGRLGVRVIAKCVERVSTMELLWSVGVHCMQGYLFGSPAPEIAHASLDLEHLARAIEPSAQGDGGGMDGAVERELQGVI